MVRFSRNSWSTSPVYAALELIDLIRRGILVAIDQPGDTEAVTLRGFALDMNMLWQRMVGRVLDEWLPNVDLKQEYALGHLIRPDPDYAPRRRSGHIPRPDFVVFRDGALMSYLDAKYRDIWEKGLPREMLYQLALYAAAHEGGTSSILYPTESQEASEERLRIQNPEDGTLRATVAFRPVRLLELEQMITLPIFDSRPERRSRFAAALVGND
jgi:5-methylcytosine-specific restriction enzyme subunit McrC